MKPIKLTKKQKNMLLEMGRHFFPLVFNDEMESVDGPDYWFENSTLHYFRPTNKSGTTAVSAEMGWLEFVLFHIALAVIEKVDEYEDSLTEENYKNFMRDFHSVSELVEYQLEGTNDIVQLLYDNFRLVVHKEKPLRKPRKKR